MDHRNDSAAPTAPDTPRGRRMRFGGGAPRTRAVVVATGILVIGITPFAAARTGSNLREGVRNGTASSETEIVANINSTTALKGGYSTRQSNLSSSGGGAIYGCRSGAGGSAAKPTPQNPCLRANNLSKGLAFEFQATNGDTGGLITVGNGGDSAKPFTTNATGVATGLNADEVDGLDATQLVALARTKANLDADTVDGLDSASLQAKFAQVAADGTAGTTRGVPDGGVTNPAGNGTYEVVFTGDLSKCAMTATALGTVARTVTVNPSVAGGNTTVDVRTFDAAAVPTDAGFHLTVNC